MFAVPYLFWSSKEAGHQMRNGHSCEAYGRSIGRICFPLVGISWVMITIWNMCAVYSFLLCLSIFLFQERRGIQIHLHWRVQHRPPNDQYPSSPCPGSPSFCREYYFVTGEKDQASTCCESWQTLGAFAHLSSRYRNWKMFELEWFLFPSLHQLMPRT